ncbi:MAG: DegT/DnrJ/EryC1/StrS family aminotransferase [bacterium]|jgi:perosamine synthetase
MIPIYKPYFNKQNLSYAHEAIDSGWVSSQGEYLDLVKNELKTMLDCKKIILTNNGTTATHLLSLALKFKHPNINKIIVPNNVYVAAWNSFLFDKNYRLIPIDCDLNTWNFDIDKIKENLDENTAILVVHNIGNVVNVPKLKRKFPNTVILEDNCEGFLGQYEDKPTGTESFASSISFFGNKTLTSGEGGAFITNDDEVFEYINCVKNQGQSDVKFIHKFLGYNYRMTNIQAALLYGQIKDYDFIIKNKNRVFMRYKEIFNTNKNILTQKIEKNTKHSNWMFGIRFEGISVEMKKNLENYLFQNGIDTRPMFYNINKHEYLKNIDSSNINADILQKECLILPSFPDLKDGQIDFISNKILKYLLINTHT